MATTKNTSKTLDDIMAKATPVERTVYVCVAGALSGEYEALRSQLDNVQTNPLTSARLSTVDKTNELLAEMDRVAAEMAEATFEFRFRAVSPKKWSDLISSHANKDGSVNIETFSIASIAATCYEPEGLDTEEAVSALLDKLSPVQQEELVNAAWEVNTSAPKGLTSFAASGIPTS